MTKSSMAQTPDRESARSPQPLRSALVLIFRVLLLSVGGLTAGLLGITLAQFRPAPAKPATEPPLLEQILRRSDALLRTVRLSDDARSSAAAAPPSPLPVASPNLTPAQRQQLQTELTTLKMQMTALGNRTATLETKLGADGLRSGFAHRGSPALLETRLQTLEQQLQPAPTSSPSPAAAAPPAPSADVLKVTLPSNALFAANQISLLPSSQALLVPVISELQRYPGATIRVAAYTDGVEESAKVRARSFAQAQAIEQYLAPALGNQYRWVAIGYGHETLATDPAANRLRRVEIGIDPH